LEKNPVSGALGKPGLAHAGTEGSPVGYRRGTGRARLRYLDPQPIVFGRIATSAIQHRDGSFSGEYDVGSVNHPSEGFVVHVHGKVLCFGLDPDGTGAVINGIITKSDFPPNPPGLLESWSVRDNGEGTNAPPDTISGLSRRRAPALGGGTP
jgi:hypothetical protein